MKKIGPALFFFLLLAVACATFLTIDARCSRALSKLEPTFEEQLGLFEQEGDPPMLLIAIGIVAVSGFFLILAKAATRKDRAMRQALRRDD